MFGIFPAGAGGRTLQKCITPVVNCRTVSLSQINKGWMSVHVNSAQVLWPSELQEVLGFSDMGLGPSSPSVRPTAQTLLCQRISHEHL
jgi:hypothetical protein